jgi:hypothetical protein
LPPAATASSTVSGCAGETDLDVLSRRVIATSERPDRSRSSSRIGAPAESSYEGAQSGCRRSVRGNAERGNALPRTQETPDESEVSGGEAERAGNPNALDRLYHPNPRKAKLFVTIATKYLLDVRSVAYVDYVKQAQGDTRRSKADRQEARSAGISRHGFPLPRSQRSNPRAVGDNPRRVAHRASR